ncbi:MAG: GLPGLI family protein [Prevotella sp.]|jgi:GLPGLI family protein|nr:GLPGLI family protein [Prevotella sp.]
MKKTILLSFFLIVALSGFAQIVIRGTTNGSQTPVSNISVTKKSKKDIKTNTLDAATIRCYYKFTQPLTVDKEVFQVADTMTLDIGPKKSVYYDGTRIKRDSVFNKMMSSGLNPSNIKSISVLKDQDASVLDGKGGTTFESSSRGETAKLYKNRQDMEVIITDREDAQWYKCTEKNTSQQWDITSDTLTVLGYLCQKATATFRGRSYEAWFTPEIPVNDGPWKLYGLPGLILKASDAENLFSFGIIGLEQLQTPVNIDMAEEEYINCSRKDLAKVKAKQNGGMVLNINGGNVTLISKRNKNEYLQLETE